MIPSSLLDSQATNGYPQRMETREVLRQRVQHERKLKTRLQLATTRLEDAERERIWAIVAAHEGGLTGKEALESAFSRSLWR